jgi:hypothetical protein
MDIVDIPEWVAQQRAAAKTQAERWQGVDPSRLLEALDLVEQLLQPSAAAAPAGIPLTVLSVRRDPGAWSPIMVYICAVISPSIGPFDTQVAALHQLVNTGALLVIPQKPQP